VPNDEQEPATISIEEAARRLNIGRALAYQSARDGSLPCIRLGRRLLVPTRALAALLEGRPSAHQS
jgi:excisionase family DNA binding protein